MLRFASSSRKRSIQIVHQQVCSYSQCFVVVVPATAAGRAWAMLSCFACAETAMPSLPVLTPRPPLRHDQTGSSSAKPPGSHRRRQPDSQRSLPSHRETELDHGTDAAETDRRTIEVSMCTVVDHAAVAIMLEPRSFADITVCIQGVGAGSPPPSVRHKQEWADRRQKLNDALTVRLCRAC